MAHRYCTTCAADVEDVGGFCLLGHPLRLQAPTATLSDLRREVNDAFEEARLQVAEVLNERPATPPSSRTSGPVAEVLNQRPARPPPRMSGPASPAAAVAPPPPPPPPRRRTVWDEARAPVAHGPDPIAAFSPAPRMDWGPDRPSLRGRLPFRKRLDGAPQV